ncbi:MAG TPA: 6-phosphogluconolactonase [Dongiaceae bacterium]|nr:6-phosphogluconolactonase [Dongiaceae bacterium]
MKTMLEKPPSGTQVRWTDCPDRASWANKAAGKIAELLEDSIAARGAASLLVAGGSTPQPIFQRLSQMHLDWAKVHVGLTDERWVRATHSDSNEHLVRHALLRNQASSARFHPLYSSAPRPSAGLAEAERSINAMPRPFDAVLLGMGTDGHFASLFPGLPETRVGLDLHNPALCVAIDRPQSGYARLSLTVTALLYAQLILVAISGRPKRTVALQALAGGADTPIAALLSHRKDDLEFLWTE